MKHWVIMYDISNNKTLSKAEKIMEAHSTRVQKSVYEAYCNLQDIEHLRNRIKKILGPDDSIAFIPLCLTDWEKTTRLGKKSCVESKTDDNKGIFL